VILAPILAGVARAVIAGIVFSGFKMLARSLNRELAEPVHPRRITRARARILVEEGGEWSEPDTARSHTDGSARRS
jgi:hypothetical protein